MAVTFLGFWVLACGGRPDPDAPLRVEFWHAMGDRGHQELLLEFARQYEETHPGVDVEPVFQGVYGTMYQKLIASITSRRPPALAMMYEGWTTRLHDRKRLDYGTDSDSFANVQASEEFGIPAWLGAAIRANDKMSRLKTFALKGSLANESVEDSLLDLAAYALIALVLFREGDGGGG